MDTHHVPSGQMIHGKRYIRLNHSTMRNIDDKILTVQPFVSFCMYVTKHTQKRQKLSRDNLIGCDGGGDVWWFVTRVEGKGGR